MKAKINMRESILKRKKGRDCKPKKESLKFMSRKPRKRAENATLSKLKFILLKLRAEDAIFSKLKSLKI